MHGHVREKHDPSAKQCFVLALPEIVSLAVNMWAHTAARQAFDPGQYLYSRIQYPITDWGGISVCDAQALIMLLFEK